MADFDQFETAAPEAAPEEDPAAAFLAREQDELAGLEGEDFGTDAAAGQQQQQEDTDFAANAFGAEDTAPAAADQGLFDPLSGGNADAPTDTTSYAADDDQSAGGSSDPYGSIRSADVQRAEPEKIRLWREAQKERLAKKDAESEQRMGELREVAKKELEDWYKHRAEQLEKTKKTNRESEEAFMQERDETLAGHEWERICRVCDFNPKASRTSRDVSRMRSILLQLKQTGLQRA